jgi:hypothetical protein
MASNNTFGQTAQFGTGMQNNDPFGNLGMGGNSNSNPMAMGSATSNVNQNNFGTINN